MTYAFEILGKHLLGQRWRLCETLRGLMLLGRLLSTLLLLCPCCLARHCLYVLQELGQPVLGGLVILQAGGERLVLQLVR